VNFKGGSRDGSPVRFPLQRGDFGEDGSVLHATKVLPTRT
jgi:hypothetical protein